MAKRKVKPIDNYLTVGKLRDIIGGLPNNTLVCVFMDGADAQNWVVNGASVKEGFVVEGLYGKHTQPCLFDVEGVDEDDYEENTRRQFLLIDVYG